MTAEDKLFVKRLTDLDRMAERKYMVCYSHFLNPAEYSLFLEHRREFVCETAVFSEIEFLERQMIAFIPDALSFHGEYPLSLLKVMPKNLKYAQTLTHRDMLGTLMGLSLDRKFIGDIIPVENGFYVLVHEQVEEFIRTNITRVKHTEVVVECCKELSVSIQRQFEHFQGTVASERLDCIISELHHCSRSQSLQLIQAGKVFINHRQVFHNSEKCKEDDIISIRHVGKFKITKLGEISKKGKVKISYDKYS